MKAQDFIDYQNENGLTVKAICESIGISYMVYYKYIRELAKPNRKSFSKLKDFYDKHIAREVVEQSVEDFFEKIIEVTAPKTEKVPLEFPEDVTAELISGNKVFCEGTGHSLKLVNGFIVRYSGDFAVSVNGAILSTDNYYSLKPIPLKLEFSKKYISKDGRVATVFASDDHIFYAVFDNDLFVRTYNEDGKCRNGDCYKDDLITEKE